MVNQPQRPSAAPSSLCRAGRRLAGGAFLALWGVLAVGTLVGLGRAHGAGMTGADDAEWRRLAAENCAGWRVYHRVGTDARTAAVVLDHLARRGRIPGVVEEVWVATETAASRRLVDLGWRVRLDGSADLRPARLEVMAADGAPIWSGRFQLAATGPGPVAIWDLRALAELGRGRGLPPVVPVGCYAAPGGRGREFGAGIFL